VVFQPQKKETVLSTTKAASAESIRPGYCKGWGNNKSYNTNAGMIKWVCIKIWWLFKILCTCGWLRIVAFFTIEANQQAMIRLDERLARLERELEEWEAWDPYRIKKHE
jgi:hypothetical protein